MNAQLPPPHTVFPESEQRRVQSQGIRYAVAMEEARDLLQEHMQDYLSPEIMAVWGEPDRARNALASVCHALATPGHYGRAPQVIAANPAVAASLNDEMRGIWARQQHVEFLAYACGSVATLLTVLPADDDGDRELIQTIAPAHQCWAVAGQDPARPLLFRVLRVVRFIDDAGNEGDGYAWYEWDIRDPAAPVYRVVEAKRGGGLGMDLTAQVEPDLLGQPYPNMRPDGRPYMPWTIHRSHDTGDLWNGQRGGSAARGTLNAMMLWSATTTAALRATGKMTILIDCSGPPTSRRRDPMTGAEYSTIDAQPGSIITVSSPDGKQGSVVEVGEVDTLPALAAYAKEYSAQLAQDLGVTPSDAARVGANPMSGAALAITNETKRMEQRRRGELARQADVHTLRVACWLLDLDPSGLGVLYDEIELSPVEQKADLESDQAEIAMGIASRVDVLMRRRPGLSREQAVAELRRIAAEERAINASAAPDPGVST